MARKHWNAKNGPVSNPNSSSELDDPLAFMKFANTVRRFLQNGNLRENTVKWQEIQQTIQKGLPNTAKYQIVRGFGFQMQTSPNFERCLHRQRMEREVYSWSSEKKITQKSHYHHSNKEVLCSSLANSNGFRSIVVGFRLSWQPRISSEGNRNRYGCARVKKCAARAVESLDFYLRHMAGFKVSHSRTLVPNDIAKQTGKANNVPFATRVYLLSTWFELSASRRR